MGGDEVVTKLPLPDAPEVTAGTVTVVVGAKAEPVMTDEVMFPLG